MAQFYLANYSDATKVIAIEPWADIVTSAPSEVAYVDYLEPATIGFSLDEDGSATVEIGSDRIALIERGEERVIIEEKEKREPVLHLTKDEAVVLYDLIRRWTDERTAPTPTQDCFEDKAEIGVLHGILAELANQMTCQFKSDYREIVGKARERSRVSWYADKLRVVAED